MSVKKPALAIVFGPAKPKGDAAPEPEEGMEDGEEKEEGQGLQELLTDYEMAPDTASKATALADFVRAVMGK